MKIRNFLRAIILMTLCASLVQAEVKKSYEQVGMWGNPTKIRFIAETEEFENSNYYIDNFMLGYPELVERMKKPYRIPAKKHYEIRLKLAKCRKPEFYAAQMSAFFCLQKKKLILINVEGNENMPDSVRCWPHAGLLFCGTAAEQVNCEVVLWDELVQGKCDMTKLVRPGDIVGFSLVITGVERGVQLAVQAKLLGASLVIAGNDSAIFRADQLLTYPGKPFDVIATSNSLSAIQQLLIEFDGTNLHRLNIPGMKTRPGGAQRTNVKEQLVVELNSRITQKKTGQFDDMDGFIVPNLDLFPAEYWETAWQRFNRVYGHKHRYASGKEVRNALGLLAQGCTRTKGTDVCLYCSIFGVGDIRIPHRKYLAATYETYATKGITEFYNATDSAFEMKALVKALGKLGISFETLTIYARAQGIALHPELLELWMEVVHHQLQLNVGIDAGDDQMLLSGIGKSSVLAGGSRLKENEQAILNIAAAGANLHYSVIFGSPGESRESCMRTIRFIEWSLDKLGHKINMIESDMFWLNYGSPASKVFYSFTYAQFLAAKAGKSITKHQWWKYFGSQRNSLVVSWETQRAWYWFFTRMSIEDAQEFNSLVTAMMTKHVGAITGRAFFPREKEDLA